MISDVLSVFAVGMRFPYAFACVGQVSAAPLLDDMDLNIVTGKW